MAKKTTIYEPLRIVSDAVKKDGNVSFGFDAYANALAEMIATKDNKTPFTIGISGKWGSGKTTLMREIEGKFKELNKEDEKENTNEVSKKPSPEITDQFRRIKTVWFNAWKYKDEEQILAALINVIIKKMEENDTFIEKEGVKKLIGYFKRFDYFNTIKEVAKGVFKLTIPVDPDKILQFKEEKDAPENKYKDYLSFYDIFTEHFDELLWKYLEVLGVTESKDALKKIKNPDQKASLVIFIDDLDRCPLPKIIQVLETIKVFLDKEGCVFVLGAAKNIIQSALENNKDYNNVDAEKFLEKIIQIDFSLPKKTHENSESFLQEIKEQLGIATENKSLLDIAIEIILPILDFNPRRIISLFNHIKLQVAILRHGDNANQVTFEKMILWRTLEIYNSVFFNDLVDDEKSYFIAKDYIEELRKSSSEEQLEQLKNKPKVEKHLVYYKDEKIQNLISSLALTGEEIKTLISYTTTFKEDKFDNIEEFKEDLYKREKEAKNQRIDYKEFIKIDAGTYNLEDLGKEEIKEAFYLAKYPVTNVWYKEFIEDGGYKKEKYWKNKTFLKKLKTKEPEYWNNAKFNQDYQPVVGVSWHEAEAFCQWLSNKTGENYFLPTEIQWQAAASGKEQKKYPWGDKWDNMKCNNVALGLERTSVVGIFKNGETHETVADMAGNIWEWTNSKDGSDYVMRGGSWFNGAVSCRVAIRFISYPHDRYYGMGFRIAHSS